MTIKYFAYGSNLHSERLGERLGRRLSPEYGGELRGYSLRFHKRSFKDGSGKCDAYKTGDPSDVVHGVIYNLSVDEKSELDLCEGLGLGYDEGKVVVTRIEAGEGMDVEETAVVYIASETHIDPKLNVYGWYRGYVLAGALYHGFPRAYIEMIKGITTVNDPDLFRSEVEMKLVEELSKRSESNEMLWG